MIPFVPGDPPPPTLPREEAPAAVRATAAGQDRAPGDERRLRWLRSVRHRLKAAQPLVDAIGRNRAAAIEARLRIAALLAEVDAIRRELGMPEGEVAERLTAMMRRRGEPLILDPEEAAGADLAGLSALLAADAARALAAQARLDDKVVSALVR